MNRKRGNVDGNYDTFKMRFLDNMQGNQNSRGNWSGDKRGCSNYEYDAPNEGYERFPGRGGFSQGREEYDRPQLQRRYEEMNPQRYGCREQYYNQRDRRFTGNVTEQYPQMESRRYFEGPTFPTAQDCSFQGSSTFQNSDSMYSNPNIISCNRPDYEPSHFRSRFDSFNESRFSQHVDNVEEYSNDIKMDDLGRDGDSIRFTNNPTGSNINRRGNEVPRKKFGGTPFQHNKNMKTVANVRKKKSKKRASNKNVGENPFSQKKIMERIAKLIKDGDEEREKEEEPSVFRNIIPDKLNYRRNEFPKDSEDPRIDPTEDNIFEVMTDANLFLTQRRITCTSWPINKFKRRSAAKKLRKYERKQEKLMNDPPSDALRSNANQNLNDIVKEKDFTENNAESNEQCDNQNSLKSEYDDVIETGPDQKLDVSGNKDTCNPSSEDSGLLVCVVEDKVPDLGVIKKEPSSDENTSSSVDIIKPNANHESVDTGIRETIKSEGNDPESSNATHVQNEIPSTSAKSKSLSTEIEDTDYNMYVDMYKSTSSRLYPTLEDVKDCDGPVGRMVVIMYCEDEPPWFSIHQSACQLSKKAGLVVKRDRASGQWVCTIFFGGRILARQVGETRKRTELLGLEQAMTVLRKHYYFVKKLTTAMSNLVVDTDGNMVPRSKIKKHTVPTNMAKIYKIIDKFVESGSCGRLEFSHSFPADYRNMISRYAGNKDLVTKTYGSKRHKSIILEFSVSIWKVVEALILRKENVMKYFKLLPPMD